MKKYHSEKDPFRDRTIIYDEHGKKVGYSEKAIFGDHVNVYDSKGNKVARQEKSFFGDHINVMLRNDWKECSIYQLHELIPLLDLLLKKHSIKMSSGLYWTQLHPQGTGLGV